VTVFFIKTPEKGDSLVMTTTINSVWRRDLIDLQQYTTAEEKSEEYIQGYGILPRFYDCPNCGNTRIGRVRCGNYMCNGCLKEWGPRQGSNVEGVRVPFVRVQHAIQLFEFYTSVWESAHPLGLTYNTVYDLFDLFRELIVRGDCDTSFTHLGEIEIDESYLEGEWKEIVVVELQVRSQCLVSHSEE